MLSPIVLNLVAGDVAENISSINRVGAHKSRVHAGELAAADQSAVLVGVALADDLGDVHSGDTGDGALAASDLKLGDLVLDLGQLAEGNVEVFIVAGTSADVVVGGLDGDSDGAVAALEGSSGNRSSQDGNGGEGREEHFEVGWGG